MFSIEDLDYMDPKDAKDTIDNLLENGLVKAVNISGKTMYKITALGIVFKKHSESDIDKRN